MNSLKNRIILIVIVTLSMRLHASAQQHGKMNPDGVFLSPLLAYDTTFIYQNVPNNYFQLGSVLGNNKIEQKINQKTAFKGSYILVLSKYFIENYSADVEIKIGDDQIKWDKKTAFIEFESKNPYQEYELIFRSINKKFKEYELLAQLFQPYDPFFSKSMKSYNWEDLNGKKWSDRDNQKKYRMIYFCMSPANNVMNAMTKFSTDFSNLSVDFIVFSQKEIHHKKASSYSHLHFVHNSNGFMLPYKKMLNTYFIILVNPQNDIVYWNMDVNYGIDTHFEWAMKQLGLIE